ncbi:hypothetical protein ZWY2020_006331 [Hordeum vulgare]|nr:hypothetical protein ZWY2020_006331 [Hordeum vulgare]
MTFTMAPAEILSSPSTRHRRMRTWMPGSLTTSPKSYRSPAGPARVVRVCHHRPRSPSADQFNKQLGNGDDIRQSPKAMAKLKKQVKRTKEILSANTSPLISVESLYNDIDFREFLGWSELDKHLDADEAIVLGASLHAANLSDGIKLNRMEATIYLHPSSKSTFFFE